MNLFYSYFIAKDVNIEGAYKVDKNKPSKYKNLEVYNLAVGQLVQE